MAGTTKPTITRWDFILCGVLVVVFIGLFAALYREMFLYKFDTGLIAQYLRSQDIPHEVPGRLFLSDSDIHISAGYLYVNGYGPTDFNFQHPPFIKYLYGISTMLTGNPFFVQLIFGAVLLLLTYVIGRAFFSSALIGALAALLLLFDPLFHHITSQALLDLGQVVFLTAFAIVALHYPKQVVLQGVLLGLAAVSKFFSPVLFVWAGIYIFQWYRSRKFEILPNVIIAGVAVIVLYIVYILTAVEMGLHMPIFYQLKMLKYWFNHSVSSFAGANILLFLFGFYKTWWGKQAIEFSEVWSLLWPVSFGAALLNIFTSMRQKIKTVPIHLFVYLFPVFYLITLALQAPFVRYFLILLPWLYCSLAYIVVYRIRHLLKLNT